MQVKGPCSSPKQQASCGTIETDDQGCDLLKRRGCGTITKTMKRVTCAAFGITMLLASVSSVTFYTCLHKIASACKRALGQEQRSTALRAACTVHQPADSVDAWTEIFDFVGSITDECRFAKVSRAHAGIVRAAHERRGLLGFVWWSSAPTVETFMTSLLKGSLVIGRQRVVAPVYAHEVNGEKLEFQGLSLLPLLPYARNHFGFHLKGMKHFDADVVVELPGHYYLHPLDPYDADAPFLQHTVAERYETLADLGLGNEGWVMLSRGERAVLGAVDASMQKITIDTAKFFRGGLRSA